MALFTVAAERSVAAAIAGLTDANPFLGARIDLEREALGPAFVATGGVWRVEASLHGLNPNLATLSHVVERLAPELRDRLAAGAQPRGDELAIYEGLVWYMLYQRFENDWLRLVQQGEAGQATDGPVDCYERFVHEVDAFLRLPGVRFPSPVDPAILFAWGYQIRRAFHHTFRRIYGGSMQAARLRATVWQSLFTHDPRRYRRALFDRVSDIPTLIVGETGTGKELVARAIGLSRFIPFDARSRSFREDYVSLFHPLNIAALPSTLVESELFGHKRGAFTGALADRQGWLETCNVGELTPDIQIKLLRVLETRGFNRLGETKERRFLGKIVAATNRDLAAEMADERFRRDLYYRLCADVIRTPTLREQLSDAPQDLSNLLWVVSIRLVGEAEAESLVAEAERWIREELGADYGWPGNVRELEQCVRSVLIRREYQPARRAPDATARDLFGAAEAGTLSAEELLRRYCTLVYAQTGSYEAAARRLGLDRRTVKAKVDRELLETLRLP
jgi:transcriptional regulator with AAA-type ATPase domain